MDMQEPRFGSLEDFINSDNPEMFDFKFQFDMKLLCKFLEEKSKDYTDVIMKINNLENIRNNIQRELAYKSQPENDIFDCDGSGEGKQGFLCWLSREIYRTLWNWKDIRNKSEEFKNVKVNRFGKSCFDECAEMGPDTMNSFETTFNQFARIDDNISGEIFKEYKNSGHLTQKYISKKFLFEICTEEKYNKYGVLEKLNIFDEFATLTSSLGNFCLVPAGYNSYRGYTEFKTLGDYWDLSLDNLKYNKDKKNWLKKMTFEKYINTFFLWDYIDENGGVKPLFSSHKKIGEENAILNSKVVLPEENEFEEFLKNVNWAIKRRGIFMVAMLKIAIKYPDVYEDIIKEIAEEKSIYSYEVVFIKLNKSDKVNQNENIKRILSLAEKEIQEVQ